MKANLIRGSHSSSSGAGPASSDIVESTGRLSSTLTKDKGTGVPDSKVSSHCSSESFFSANCDEFEDITHCDQEQTNNTSSLQPPESLNNEIFHNFPPRTAATRSRSAGLIDTSTDAVMFMSHQQPLHSRSSSSGHRMPYLSQRHPSSDLLQHDVNMTLQQQQLKSQNQQFHPPTQYQDIVGNSSKGTSGLRSHSSASSQSSSKMSTGFPRSGDDEMSQQVKDHLLFSTTTNRHRIHKNTSDEIMARDASIGSFDYCDSSIRPHQNSFASMHYHPRIPEEANRGSDVSIGSRHSGQRSRQHVSGLPTNDWTSEVTPRNKWHKYLYSLALGCTSGGVFLNVTYFMQNDPSEGSAYALVKDSFYVVDSIIMCILVYYCDKVMRKAGRNMTIFSKSSLQAVTLILFSLSISVYIVFSDYSEEFLFYIVIDSFVESVFLLFVMNCFKFYQNFEFDKDENLTVVLVFMFIKYAWDLLMSSILARMSGEFPGRTALIRSTTSFVLINHIAARINKYYVSRKVRIWKNNEITEIGLRNHRRASEDEPLSTELSRSPNEFLLEDTAGKQILNSVYVAIFITSILNQ